MNRNQLLQAAILGWETQVHQIQENIATAKQQLNGKAQGGEEEESPTPPLVKMKRKKKRRLSPEGRANIVAAMKKRWAAKKKAERG
jgi:hypothetical protein